MLAGVSDDLQQGFARILAMREQQTKMRVARSEQLSRLVAYFRARLADFLSRTDPITGARLIDIGAEESRAHGGLSVVVAMFEGSRLKIAVDAFGRYTHASIPEIFGAIGRIIEVRVAEDLSRADLCYLAPGDTHGPIRIEPVETFLLVMMAKTIQTIESQTDEPLGLPAAESPAPTAAAAPVAPSAEPSVKLDVK